MESIREFGRRCMLRREQAAFRLLMASQRSDQKFGAALLDPLPPRPRQIISQETFGAIEAEADLEGGVLALTADMIFAEAAVPGEGQPALDPTRPRPFEMLAYSGGKLLLPNYDHPVVADLQGMQWTTPRIPIRARHDKGLLATIGQTTDLGNDKRQIRASGFVSPKPDAGKHIVDMSGDGFKWQASIEAKLLAPTQFIQAGQTITVNGQQLTGPFYLAPKTRLTGIGVVEMGADPQSSAVIAATSVTEGGSAMTFESWCAANGVDPSALDPGQLALAKAMYAGAQAEGAEPMQASQIAAALGAVRASVTPPGAGAGGSGGGGGGGNPPPDPNRNQQPVAASMERLEVICAGHPDIEAQAIEGGWDEGRTQRAVRVATLRGSRPQGRLPATSFTNAERRLDANVLQASMLLASGMSEEQIGHSFETLDRNITASQREQIVNMAAARANRVTSFSGIFRRLLSARGLPTPDSREDLMYEAIYASQNGQLEIEAAVGNTTVSLPGIFGDYMNKNLLASFEQLPSVIPDFCQEVDAQDFKPLHNFRFDGMGGEMYELGPTGELKTVTLTEETWTNRLKTRGFMLTLPREMIINDDLGVTKQITNLIGLNARRTRERIGFRTLLRAWTTLFTTATTTPVHSLNKLTGAGSALAADGNAVRSAITLFAKQKSATGDPIMVAPDRLICGTTLGPLADDLYTKDTIQIAGTAGSVTTAFTQNRVKGKLRPVVSPFMDPGNSIFDTDGTTDLGSDTKWAAACDPLIMALVQFIYLNGKRSPTVETRADASFNTLGMSWRCFWDINASSAEFRAGVGSDGQ